MSTLQVQLAPSLQGWQPDWRFAPLKSKKHRKLFFWFGRRPIDQAYEVPGGDVFVSWFIGLSNREKHVNGHLRLGKVSIVGPACWAFMPSRRASFAASVVVPCTKPYAHEDQRMEVSEKKLECLELEPQSELVSVLKTSLQEAGKSRGSRSMITTPHHQGQQYFG